jgi:hypothetical protein
MTHSELLRGLQRFFIHVHTLFATFTLLDQVNIGYRYAEKP